MTSVLDTQSPLLWRACLAGEVAIMDKIMDRGVDPRKTDRNGESCLHMSARSGEVDAVERMVHAGLDLNHANHNGQTPLHVAVSKGHTSVVRFIVRNRGNTDLQSKFSGMTALHLSCVENDADIAQFLLDNGANCAIQDAIGKYADDYTEDDSILGVFDSHFPECTHGRRKKSTKEKVKKESGMDAVLAEAVKPKTTAVEQPADINEPVDDDDNDETESPKLNRKLKKRRSKRDMGELKDRKNVDIYDKMETYDVERAKQNWDTAKREGKKIKVNHSLGFSNEHKQRMAQNVFDRLMGGKKK